MKGLDRAALESIRSNLRLSEGTDVLIATLKRLGYTLGVVSGGFRFFADHLKEALDLDFAFANQLEFKGDRLTGRVTGDVVDDAENKRMIGVVHHKAALLAYNRALLQARAEEHDERR